MSTSDWDLEAWARGVSINAGMRVSIGDAGVSVLQVQGPKSPIVMSNLFGDDILDLRYYWLARVPFEATSLVISRTGWSGEFGYEIYLENADFGDKLFEALMNAGKSSNLKPGAVNQIRRVESGILSAGVDFTPTENPYEIGLSRLVETDSGASFIGREALLAQRDKEPARRLVGLIVDGAALASNEDVWVLTHSGETVGRLTSIVYSPQLEKNIALGIVPTQLAHQGSVFGVSTWDGPRSATVSTTPFVPKKQSGSARDLVSQNSRPC